MKLTDEQIINIRKGLHVPNPQGPFADTLAFARAVLEAASVDEVDVPREITCPHCGMPFETTKEK